MYMHTFVVRVWNHGNHELALLHNNSDNYYVLARPTEGGRARDLM